MAGEMAVTIELDADDRELLRRIADAVPRDPWFVVRWRKVADDKPDFRMEDLHGNSDAARLAKQCLDWLAST